MLLLKYIILGFIQGFTEPLPISSSGHVILFKHLFAINIEGLSFEMIVNFGSLIAIIIIYWQDVFRLLKNGLDYLLSRDSLYKHDFNYLWLIIVTTIPAGITGLLLNEKISSDLSTVQTVGITLLITAGALLLIRSLTGHKYDHDITIRDAVLIGLAQAVALVPGISRSGATIVCAMLLGLKRETALRFSFLMYIPVSLGVTILSINDIIKDPFLYELALPYLIALIMSLIASIFALKWFINIMRQGKLIYFASYCFVVGLIIIVFL